MDEKNGHRTKIFYVPWHVVKDILLNLDQYDYLQIPDFKEIPKDSKIKHVFLSPERDAFGFVISHPSFDIIPIGCLSPEIDTYKSVCFKKVKVKKQ